MTLTETLVQTETHLNSKFGDEKEGGLGLLKDKVNLNAKGHYEELGKACGTYLGMKGYGT